MSRSKSGKAKKAPSEDKIAWREDVAAALRDGSIPLRRFRFQRVGFNQAVYDLLLGGTSGQALAVAGDGAEQGGSEDDDNESE